MSKSSNKKKVLKLRLIKNRAKTEKPFTSNRISRHKHDQARKIQVKLSSSDTTTAPAINSVSDLRHQFSRKQGDGRSSLSEISREATAGGVIYRFSESGQLEILLVADHFDRWTIPKGHIEPGETAQETAIREIGEEAGVHQLDPICWLGKIHFRYRRDNILVLMSTQIYLFKALGDTNDIKKEDWMNDIKWFSFDRAVEIIAYKDIAKLMKLGYHRLQQRKEID